MTDVQHNQPLLDSIRNRTATVGVIGLGYVGLPLVLLFSERGFPVIGFDVDTEKVEALTRGDSYIRHIGPERVAAYRRVPAEDDRLRREHEGERGGGIVRTIGVPADAETQVQAGGLVS